MKRSSPVMRWRVTVKVEVRRERSRSWSCRRVPVNAESDPAPPDAEGPTAVDLAVLDAPVLGRGAVTVFLLHVAAAGAFDPVWSDQIHTDWTRDALRLHPDIPAERFRQRRHALDQAFPVANILASRDVLDEVLVHCATPAERKSAHVLATAVAARAAVIVTDGAFCLKGVITKLWHDMAVHTADAWCVSLLSRHEAAMLTACRAHRAHQGTDIEAWLAALTVILPGMAAGVVPMRERL